MTPKNAYAISAAIFFLGFVAGGIVFSAVTFFQKIDPVSNGGNIACTMDAKICPDGSGVGRTGPNCEFAECPGQISGGSGSIGGGLIYPDNGIDTIACPEDVKICPDGSSVGRTGLNCEFSKCSPTIPKGEQGSICQSDSDCSKGYECIDPSPVMREGYSNLRCWQKGSPRPICLSGDARIGTPKGDVSVKDIKKGMSVWTIDRNGKKVPSIVMITGKTFVSVGHKVVHIQLSDGRNLYVSPGHKVADGRKAGELRPGNILQGSSVLSVNLIPYTEEYTYDILPSAETGMYFANGILLQSTLGINSK
jgi:hypothetical protein